MDIYDISEFTEPQECLAVWQFAFYIPDSFYHPCIGTTNGKVTMFSNSEASIADWVPNKSFRSPNWQFNRNCCKSPMFGELTGHIGLVS